MNASTPHSSDFAIVRDYIRRSLPMQPVQGFPGADANDALSRLEEQLEASRRNEGHTTNLLDRAIKAEARVRKLEDRLVHLGIPVPPPD